VVHRLVAVAELADLEPVARTVRGRELLVVRVGEEVFAFDAYCTHRDAPLAQGAVTRKRTVLCPWHLGTFRITDGSVVAGPPDSPLRGYPVVVRDGWACLEEES
jgi:nitrite reductase/ring-hydroxylating ferredoxin subunit